jgi:ribosomal protein S18 acetylase RimI-like enzyme
MRSWRILDFRMFIIFVLKFINWKISERLMEKIVEGKLKDLKHIVKIDEVVFGKAKKIKEIEGKLVLCKNVHITLGKMDERLVGYGIGYEEKGKYYLWMLAVLPEFRKHGFGKRIFEEQINFAKKKRYDTFLVKSSNKWKDMLRLTIKLGFDIVGFKINEWGSNSAIWLSKDLK